MGFIRDQDGIMNRYLRERSNWEPHLQRTKEFIEGSFNNEHIRSVAILGSGWLLDVPLEAMSDRFDRLYLVDIRHPPQIRKRVENMKNVDLIEKDLTGGAAEQLWRSIQNWPGHDPDKLLEAISFSPPLEQVPFDGVVSVNLLNQLDIILCDYLNKRGHFQQTSLLRFRAWLQATHLEWITRTPGCIITDTIEVNVDRHGQEIRKNLLYSDLPEGFRTASWKWEFDTQGTYRPGSRTHMEIHAVEWI
jgi:hypothetical protein